MSRDRCSEIEDMLMRVYREHGAGAVVGVIREMAELARQHDMSEEYIRSLFEAADEVQRLA